VRVLEPKVMDLLVFLASRPGEVVTRQEIFEKVWAGVIVTDETLSRAVSILRAELGDETRNPRYIKTVLKRGYCCIAEVNPGLAGPGSSGQVARTGRGTGPGARTWDRGAQGLAISLGILAVVAIMVWLALERRQPALPRSQGLSIAVLPFANRGSSEDDAFFVNGFHDELLSHIAKISSIKTISATSVRQYRDTTKTIPEIASELGVSTVVEGGVQRIGEQVRINVQLIDAVTDEHLWAEIYDRQLTAANVFAIQTEIATAVAHALKATLTLAERGRIETMPTDNLAALEQYFLGRQRLERRTTAELSRAVQHFEEAIRLDPSFALAYVGLADTFRLQASYGDVPIAEADTRGRLVVDMALRLDSQLGEAYASLANLERRDGNFSRAREAFDQALALRPNYASAYQWYGEFLAMEVGEFEEALQYSRRAVELDPLSAIIHTDYAEALDAAGRFGEALSAYQRAIEIDPGFAVAYAQTAIVHWYGLGQPQQALRWYWRAIELDPGSSYLAAVLGQAYLDLGDQARASELIETSLEKAPGSWLNNRAMSQLALYRGNRSQAVEFARHTVSLRPHSPLALAVLGEADALSGHHDAARTRYEHSYPDFMTTEPEINILNFEAAVDFALVLTRLEQHQRAERMLSAASGFIEGRPRLGFKGYWITDVKIHAQRGELERAVSALEQALEAGWRNYWWYYLEHDASLAPLRSLPRFREILENLRLEMTTRLEQAPVDLD